MDELPELLTPQNTAHSSFAAMATLNLSRRDLDKIRGSWTDVTATTSDDVLVRRMFTALMASSADAKQALADRAVLSEQRSLFAELLGFTMMYLHDESLLNECLDEFIKENPTLVKYGVRYLEPMGAVVIQTMRGAMGSEKFHAGLETLWIKLYVYLANCILVNDISDAELVISAGQGSSSSEVEGLEPVAPLSFKSPEPKMPAPGASHIVVDVQKYKGFRRLAGEGSAVLIPTSPLVNAKKTDAKTSQSDPVLTPRSSRRNVALTASLVDDDLVVHDVNQKPFDPRRRSSHRRQPLDLSLHMECDSSRKLSASSYDSPVSDVEDTFRLAEAEMDFTAAPPARPPVFDSNSFGLRGLAPIAETDDDEDNHEARLQNSDGLSHYAATVERDDVEADEDEQSSRTSLLSLHNLDYKSLISSGSGPEEKVSPRQPAQIPQFSPKMSHLPQLPGALPYMLRAFLGLMPSLCSRSSGSGQRASLGFMRLSFVLKKEMSELGYNLPENVYTSALSQMRETQSVMALPLQSLPAVTNLEIPARAPERASARKTETISQLTKPAIAPAAPAAKKSFRSRLGSLFSSLSASAPAKPAITAKDISAPKPLPKAPVRQHEPHRQPVKASASHSQSQAKASKTAPLLKSSRSLRANYSMGEATFALNRMSSLDIRLIPPPPGYAHSVYSKATSDACSVRSENSHNSGFHLFRKNGQPQLKYPLDTTTQKKQKYMVKKVPYKTIYVKDIIRS